MPTSDAVPEAIVKCCAVSAHRLLVSSSFNSAGSVIRLASLVGVFFGMKVIHAPFGRVELEQLIKSDRLGIVFGCHSECNLTHNVSSLYSAISCQMMVSYALEFKLLVPSIFISYLLSLKRR